MNSSSGSNVVISGRVVDHCQKSDCLDGNCSGCKNGNLWCDDPRCHPNCEDCPPNDNTFITFLIIVFVIFGLFLLGFLIYAIWKGNRPDEINHHYLLERHPHPNQVILSSSVGRVNPVNFVSASPPATSSAFIPPSAPIISQLQSEPFLPSYIITGFEKIPDT